MPAVYLSTSVAEAFVLGLATGPVCLASCGPVVLPWMMTQPQGFRRHGKRLAIFLAGRLAGYLSFAIVAWNVGAAIPSSWAARNWVYGAVELALAAALLVYAAGWPHPRCRLVDPIENLVQVGPKPRRPPSGALALGFLTGINLCPPFLVAAVRAAQLPNLGYSLLFFTSFFAATAIWFTPLLTLSWIRRSPVLVTVARMASLLLVGWYALSGVRVLLERVYQG
ncbi:MAG: sulfite exporter TauE/SafE family protein [Terracidiphilus sp.]